VVYLHGWVVETYLCPKSGRALHWIAIYLVVDVVARRISLWVYLGANRIPLQWYWDEQAQQADTR